MKKNNYTIRKYFQGATKEFLPIVCGRREAKRLFRVERDKLIASGATCVLELFNEDGDPFVMNDVCRAYIVNGKKI